jgi:4-hydroxythreonine-4-phosphate dehydrogenase
MGEPAGIGPELAGRAWHRLRQTGPAFLFLGDDTLLSGVPVARITGAASAASVFPEALPVLHRPLQTRAVPGQPNPRTASAVIAAIAEAVALVLQGEASGIVTNPIQKGTLVAAGFRHPGHTEFLAELCGAANPVMMLVAPRLTPVLRTVPVTIHEPLRAALARLDTGMIIAAARAAAAALCCDFGVAAPRLALSGVNPHAGEGGTMGREDREIVEPAVAALRAEGLDARGPLPADTLFTPNARAGYDAAICMYHDQALIPVKTLDMAGGVNVTLGLPIVRTSPDHGTALDLAGRGTADPNSLIAALEMAASMVLARSRKESAQ